MLNFDTSIRNIAVLGEKYAPQPHIHTPFGLTIPPFLINLKFSNIVTRSTPLFSTFVAIMPISKCRKSNLDHPYWTTWHTFNL